MNHNPVLVKGSPLKSLIKFLRTKSGLSEEQYRCAVASLPGDHQAIINGIVVPTRWYPLDCLNQLLKKCAAELGIDSLKLAHDAGRFGAKEAIGSIFSFLASIAMPPESMVRKAAPAWQSIYNQGHLDVDINAEKTGGRATAVDFVVDPIVCARISGWFEYIGEISRSATIYIQHHHRGIDSPHCYWEFHWA